MNRNNAIIYVIVVILLVGAGLYYFTKNKNNIPNTPIVSESSIKGCYVSIRNKDVYTLEIRKDEGSHIEGVLAYNNYGYDSSSGTFIGTYANGILSGNYSFEAEGAHSERQLIWKKEGNNFVQGFGDTETFDGKEVISDINKVVYNPSFTFEKRDNCIVSFTDRNNTFTFDYNSFFKGVEGENTPTTDWKLDSKEKGILLASVIVPKTYMPGTNFSEARLTIGRVTSPKGIKSCTVDTNNEKKDGEKNIDIYTFTKFTSNDAAAGNRYDTTSYRGIMDGDCYALEYTIHSTNIDNYPPEQQIKEFDKTKIQSDLEKIISSFEFLISSD
ncbi:MAG TPA: hypothetical protein VK153_02735 [Candidatus Paceibacterota bacterium]|nr:hypothetical protein [Candidatus Paceibacterota bacterium]